MKLKAGSKSMQMDKLSGHKKHQQHHQKQEENRTYNAAPWFPHTTTKELVYIINQSKVCPQEVYMHYKEAKREQQ